MDDCSEADAVIDFDELMENDSVMNTMSVEEANSNVEDCFLENIDKDEESFGANTTIDYCFLEYLDNEESRTVAQFQGELTPGMISLFCTTFVFLLDDNIVLQKDWHLAYQDYTDDSYNSNYESTGGFITAFDCLVNFILAFNKNVYVLHLITTLFI